MSEKSITEAMAQVLEAGIGLDVFGVICAYKLCSRGEDNCRFEVLHENVASHQFVTAEETAAKFRELQEKYQVGYEYEAEE